MYLIAPIVVAATVSTGLVGLPSSAVVTSAPPAVTPQIQTIDLEPVVADSQVAAAAELSADDTPSVEPSVAPSAAAPSEFTAEAAEADVLTERLDVEPFVATGVTWDAGTAPAGMQVQVRVREAGAWTAWNTLAVNDSAPDAGTDEASSAREGTEPLLTAGSDGVQVRVDSADGSMPEGLEVDLIDPGTSAHDQLVGEDVELASAATGPTRPAVVTRAQWGADESLARSSATNYGVSALVLHHTAGSNSYSQAQSVQQMRGVYAYHTKSLGWADVGYNMLIDRYGTVYEGRRGSLTGTPRGAHTGGFNKGTYGISVMGNFETSAVPSVVVRRLTEVVAWKMWDLDIKADDTVRLTSAGGKTRFPAGTTVSLSTFAAHIDLSYTSCPGVHLISKMPGITSEVKKRLAAAAAPPVEAPLVVAPPAPAADRTFPKDFSGDARADVVALDAAGRMLLYPGNGKTGFTAPRQIGKGWNTRDLVTMAGDWDGDGHPDVLARNVSTGQLWLYRGSGRGGFISGKAIGGSWRSVDAIVGVGDWDTDGNVDVLARIRSTGALNLYSGNGKGGFLATRQLGTGWTGMDELVPTGGFAAKGVPSFMGRNASNGRLYLYQAGPDGDVASRTQVGTGWGAMRQMLGLGDFDGSGTLDLVAKTSDNRLVLYRGDGAGTFAGTTQIGKGWGALTILD